MDIHSDSAENEFDAILAETDKEIGVGDLMGKLGCGFTADAQQCKEILSSFAPLGEATISRIFVNVARPCADLEDNHSTSCCIPSELPTPKSWNVDILVDTIKLLQAPGTSWRKVIENLDHDGFDIPNMESFSFFMRLYKTACKEPFPLDAVCASVWKNMEGQLSFLKHAISAPPEVFTFMHSPRKLVYNDNMHSHEQQLGLSNHAWLSLDLLDVLCQLAERGHAVLVSSLLQDPLTHCPRTLLLGMTHIKTASNLIQREVVSAIFPVIITNSQDSGFILNFWHQDAELFLWGILGAQNLKADSMLRIIEICRELKILPVVLESVPVSFSIRLAVLASLRGLLDIENWLQNCLHVYKDRFAEECLKFVKNVHFSDSEDFTAKHFHPSDPLADLYLDATTSFLKVPNDRNNCARFLRTCLTFLNKPDHLVVRAYAHEQFARVTLNEAVSDISSSPAPLFQTTSNLISLKLAAVYHVSQAIMSLWWTRHLQYASDDISSCVDLSKCACGDPDCIVVCDIHKCLPTSKLDRKLRKLVMLLGESYLSLGESYSEDGRLIRALNTVKLACSMYGSMPQKFEETSSVSSMNMSPSLQSVSHAAKQVEDLQAKLGPCDTSVGEISSTCVFWARIWKLVGDVHCQFHTLKGLEPRSASYLKMPSEVAEEVDRFTEYSQGCASCAIVNSSCKSDIASSSSNGILEYLTGQWNTESSLVAALTCYQESRRLLQELVGFKKQKKNKQKKKKKKKSSRTTRV